MVKNLRRIMMACLALCTTAMLAFGNDHYPVDIAMPSVVTGGSYESCNLTVEGNGTAHIQSIPAGVVDVEVPVIDGVNQISLAISPSYFGGVVLYATMEGSNQTVSTSAFVMPNN